MRLEGLARDGEDVSELARRTEALDYFDDVRLLPGARRRSDKEAGSRSSSFAARSEGEVLMARGDSALARLPLLAKFGIGGGLLLLASSASPTSSSSTATSPASIKAAQAQERQLARAARGGAQGRVRLPEGPARSSPSASSASASSNKILPDDHRVSGVPERRSRTSPTSPGVSLTAWTPQHEVARAVLRARADEARARRAASTRSRSSSTASVSSIASSTWRTSRSPIPKQRGRRRDGRGRGLATAFRTVPEGAGESGDKRRGPKRATKPAGTSDGRARNGPRAPLRDSRRLPVSRSAARRSVVKAASRALASDGARPRRRRRSPRRRHRPTLPPLPKFEFQEADFAETERSRDPFRSLRRNVRRRGARARVKSQREVVLDQYALDELKLVGIVTRIQPAQAPCWSTPRGKGHVDQARSVRRPAGGRARRRPDAAPTYEINWRVDRIRDGDIVLVREDPAQPRRSRARRA